MTANSKQNPILSQINAKFLMKCLSTWFLLPNTSCFTLNWKAERHAKIQKHNLKRQSKPWNQTQIWQEILKLSNRKFKITMNNMLRVLTEKMDNILVQRGNVSRKVAILWKNQKEMLENKNLVTEMKNPSYGPISRLDMTKTKISLFEKHVNRNFQNGNIKRKKWMKK